MYAANKTQKAAGSGLPKTGAGTLITADGPCHSHYANPRLPKFFF